MQPKDQTSRRDHATIMPQLSDGTASGPVLPRSYFCGVDPIMFITANNLLHKQIITTTAFAARLLMAFACTMLTIPVAGTPAAKQ